MKRLIAVVSLCAIAPSAALAASGKLTVSPATVSASKKVKVSGSVSGCKSPVTISSAAFGSKQVNAPLKHHNFSVKIRVKATASGSYKVSGRCGGSRFATATLNVTGFY